MQAHQPDSDPAAMGRLAALVGEWVQQVEITGVAAGQAVITLTRGGWPASTT
jgi:hypothetical protein